MNKFLLASLLLSVALIAISPIVFAETVPAELNSCIIRHTLNDSTWVDRGIICPGINQTCNLASTTQTCAICCLVDKVYTFTDWLFVAIVIFVTIKILQGGYEILTSAGDAAKLTAGRAHILWALAGMAVALFARVIPQAVVGLLR